MDLTPKVGPEDIAIAVRAVLEPLGATIVADDPLATVSVEDKDGNAAPLYPEKEP